MSADEQLAAVLRTHLPRDRYDDDDPIGTECTCGGWEGDYFADGEAGPFDLHLAAALADAGYVHRGEASDGDAIRDREFGNLRWMDGHQQGLKDGRAEAVDDMAGAREGRHRLLDCDGKVIETHESLARAEYLLARFPRAERIVTETRLAATPWAAVTEHLGGEGRG